LQVFADGANLVPQSEATTGWTNTGTTFGSAAVAPDGNSTAFTITDTTAASAHLIKSGSISVTAGHQYVVSAFVKAGTCATNALAECHIGNLSSPSASLGNAPGIVFDAANCTVFGGTGNIAKALPPKPFANGWCRIGFIVTATGTSLVAIDLAMANGLATYTQAPSYAGQTGGSTLLAWGFYVKEGTTLLPYCPSYVGTCNADVMTAGGSDTTLKGAFEGAAVRIVAQTAEFYESQPLTSAPTPVNRTLVGVGSALTALGITDPGYQARTTWPITATLTSAGQIIRYQNTNYFGLSADASGRSMALNGQAAVSDSNGVSATTAENIGSISTPGSYCNCIIARLTVWNTRNDAAMKAATNNAAALPVLASYTGSVANHTNINNAILAPATATQAMTISHHRATENITTMQVVFGNYYHPNSASSEVAAGSATAITASVEYPKASCQSFLFNGSSSGSIPSNASGSSALTTDSLTLANPIPAGADFWIRSYRTNAISGIIDQNTTSPFDSPAGDAMHYGTSGISDQTTTCDTVTKTSVGTEYYPDAIVGATQLHSYCLVGDSRGFGTNDVISDQLDASGEVERWVVPYNSVLRILVPGDTAASFVSAGHSINRHALLAYCSGMIVEYSGNDIFRAGNSPGTVERNLTTLYGYQSQLRAGAGGPVWQTTLHGQTRSGNSWQDIAGQSLYANSGNAITLNTWIRANTAGITGYFEVANAVNVNGSDGITPPVEYWCLTPTTTTSGIANGCTSDGLHPSPYAYGLIMNALAHPTLQ